MSMPDALAELAKSFSQEGKELRVRRGGGENSTHYMVDTPHGTAYFDVDPSEKHFPSTAPFSKATAPSLAAAATSINWRPPSRISMG